MTKDRGIPNRQIRKTSSAQRSTPAAKATVSPHVGSGMNPRIRAIVNRVGVARNWLFNDWRGIVALSFAVTGSATALSLAFLFKLPAVPNCPSIFWPLASASLRLHCAQIAANKRTANDLLEAIKLVSTLPPDHPLYNEAQRFIEVWSQDILDLGEETFQAGKLDEAIAIAKRVPKVGSAHREVDNKIKRWQGIWASAESIYLRAENALRKQNWRQALTDAARLLSIDNTFWQTTKYQELTEKISSTREDIIKLAKAKDLIDTGGLKNLLEAIKLASGINDTSYVYQGAQELIADTGKEMLELAEAALDRKDLATASDIVRQIPPAAKLQREVEDFDQLASAASKAWNGTPEDYDAAIAAIQTIGSDRPLYTKAQTLIARWQAEKGDLAQLNRARQLAQSGRPEDLQAAIASAEQIPSSNPKGREARDLISQATNDLQIKEDRPTIDQADQLASRGDANSLQQAIELLNRISSRRTLGSEARDKRQQYARQLQDLRDRDRVVTDQNLRSPNPDDPQIRDNAQAEQSLRSAQEAASGGTVDSLAEAIRRADGVGVASPMRPQAQGLMNQWSQQLLQTALAQASNDVTGAIAIAQKIPPGTEAYSQAQLQIQAWRRRLGQ